MNVILVQRQQSLMRPSIYGESTSTWMSKSKELLNINQRSQQMSLLERRAEVAVDEFGFIPKADNIPKHKLTFAGRGVFTCRGRCIHIPKKDSRKVSYSKTKDFFCVTCSIAMKCVRCRCCGRQGRREPRSRNRFTRAILNGGKYIE